MWCELKGFYLPHVESNNKEPSISDYARAMFYKIPFTPNVDDPHYTSWCTLAFLISGIKTRVQKILDTHDEGDFIKNVSSLTSYLANDAALVSSPDLGSFFIRSGFIELLDSKVFDSVL